MRKGWKKVRLGEVIIFRNGKKRPIAKGKFPVYGGNGILDYTYEFNYESGVIIGRVGAYCGSVYFEPNKHWVSDNAISAASNEKSDLLFDYYLLNSLQLNKRQIGTSQPLLTQEILNCIEVNIPPLSEQRTIAVMLFSLDEKIALNSKINHHLEQMAQTIFKSWFVDFEPWNGEMPCDWNKGFLSDIANITMGQSPDGSSYNEDGFGMVFYQGRAEFGSRFPTRRMFTKEPKRMAAKGDVLISVRAPVGDLNVAFESCCVGRGLAAIQSNNNCQSFVLYTMFALKQRLELFNGEGTVFGSINKDDMANLPVLIPPDQMICKFEKLVSTMDAYIETIHSESNNLQALRDTLLPRLMSGELSVSDLDTVK